MVAAYEWLFAQSKGGVLERDLARRLKSKAYFGQDIGETKVRPEQLSALVSLLESGKVSGTAAKEVLGVMFETGSDPEAIVRERGGATSTQCRGPGT